MDIPPGETLTRFIRYNRDFAEPNTVRHQVFLPHKKKTDISVFCISELLDNEVWRIGLEHVQTDELPVLARADLFASDVYENNLEVIPDPQSHEAHANITGFPAEREENKTEDRKLRRSIARKLANASKLVLIPTE